MFSFYLQCWQMLWYNDTILRECLVFKKTEMSLYILNKILNTKVNAMKKTVDPRMHSAEHILNQTMDRLFGCGRCVNAHVEKKKSKCDYRFDRNLTGDETANIEMRVNEIIQKNLAVTETLMSKDEAQRSYIMEKVPSHAENIRIVKVGDYDACPLYRPSCGSHSGNRSIQDRFHEL